MGQAEQERYKQKPNKKNPQLSELIISLGRTSKASAAQLANLTKTTTALNSHKATVEDVTESDSKDMEYDPMMDQQTDTYEGEFYFV